MLDLIEIAEAPSSAAGLETGPRRLLKVTMSPAARTIRVCVRHARTPSPESVTVNRFILLATVAAMAACSGGDKQITPPGGGGTAAVVTIFAGDNQSAAVGTVVAAAPSVIVRDAGGLPVVGAAVTFTVDSGSGSIANGSQTTGTGGLAMSGAWTLGPGRNRLRAAAGSLTPVFFTATGTTDTQLATAPIGPGGGVLTVATPGAALDGLTLTVPAGAVAATTQFTLALGDSVNAPKKPGLRLVSPVITLRATGPVSDAGGPVKITVPAVTSTAELPVAILFDRTTGARMPVPTVRLGATKVATLIRVFNGDSLAATRAAQRSAPQFRADASALIQIVIGAVPFDSLNKDQTTGYVPLVDDWEFDNLYSGIPAATRDVQQSSLAITAAWYFDKEKGARGNLNGRYQQAKGIERSNARGLKLKVETALALDLGVVASYAGALETLRLSGDPVIPGDSVTLLAIKAGIYVTGRPYVIIAQDSLNQYNTTSLLIYRTVGSAMDVSLGTSASETNAPRTLRLLNGRFGRLTSGVKSPDTGAIRSFTTSNYFATGVTSGLPAAKLSALWQSFFDNTIGVGDQKFPTTTVASRESANVGDTLFVPDDTTRFWVECKANVICTTGYPVTGNFTPTQIVAGGNIYRRKAGGVTWDSVGTGTAIYGAGLRVDSTNNGLTVGLAAFADAGGGLAQWIDWKQFTIVVKRMTVAIAPVTPAGGYDFTVTATYARPTPANARWEWQMGDGRTLTTTTRTLTTSYPATSIGRAYDIKVSMKVGTTLEATGRVRTTVVEPVFAWEMRTATVTASALPPGGIGNQRLDTLIFNRVSQIMANLQAAPSNNAIFVAGLANGGAGCDAGVLFYQHPPGGAFDSTSVQGVLGSCGDPDYDGNVTLGTIGAGTLVASASEIPMQGVIVLPGGSINATMTGINMNGSFVLRVRYSTGYGSYTVQFTGVQIKP